MSPDYVSADSARADARERLLFDTQGRMTEFGTAHYTVQALQNKIPDNLVSTYVEWHTVRKTEGADYSAGWYEDDWFLMEHPEFERAMLDLGIWTQERDFSKVPARQVYDLYKSYLGLPQGSTRIDFRCKHPELDDWLVLAKQYTPVGDRCNP